MKKHLLIAAASISVAFSLTNVAQAANLAWGTVRSDSAVTGGPGNWDTSTVKSTSNGGVNNASWVNANNDTAVFGGTGD